MTLLAHVWTAASIKCRSRIIFSSAVYVYGNVKLNKAWWWLCAHRASLIPKKAEVFRTECQSFNEIYFSQAALNGPRIKLNHFLSTRSMSEKQFRSEVSSLNLLRDIQFVGY